MSEAADGKQPLDPGSSHPDRHPGEVPFDLVLITGMSGAGRTEALHTFEDLGYFCIDNLPPALIGQLVELAALPGSLVRRIAVACDVRGGIFFDELAAELDELDMIGHPFRTVFLTADDKTLVRRFKETRRRHPLAEAGSVAEGIREERAKVEALKRRADLIVDTSTLLPQELRSMLRERFVGSGRKDQLTVSVSSFGFKYGMPIDADLVIDVRFLPNPFYIERLRPKTGLDKPVRTYVLEQPDTAPFLERWFALIEFLLPHYLAEGKAHLNIALGCTGGVHRSVALSEATGEFVRKLGYDVTVSHRDMRKGRCD